MSLRALSIRLCAQARTRSFSSSSSRSNASRYGCSAVWHRPVHFLQRGHFSHKHTAKRGKDLHSTHTHTHLDLCKEVSEAAFGVHLKRLRQVQYELHDDGLVGRLLHQAMFLGRRNTQHCSSADPSSSHHLLTACMPALAAALPRVVQKASVWNIGPELASFEVEAAAPPPEEVGLGLEFTTDRSLSRVYHQITIYL